VSFWFFRVSNAIHLFLFIQFERILFYEQNAFKDAVATLGIYLGRTAGGHRYHWYFGRLIASGRSSGT
jgi:hypothetical protein